jgi:hypothetical protein
MPGATSVTTGLASEIDRNLCPARSPEQSKYSKLPGTHSGLANLRPFGQRQRESTNSKTCRQKLDRQHQFFEVICRTDQ